MSVLGIASSSIFSQINSIAAQQSKSQKLQQGFQQLGQDLQSGNLSQAQSDFASLQQLLPGGQQNPGVASTSGTQSSNPLATAVSQLAQDLQSGNLTAAQSDLATVQQDVQQSSQQQGAGQAHHHHHHHGGGNSSQSSSEQNAISTLFSQLGQSLQSGNLSAAQQAYSSLQQDFQLFGVGANSASSGTSSSSTSTNLSVSA
jgi:outer membrane protein assembly factor BamD (BamD/ComL family)